jgi:predicted O-methyltransferase YrrM
MRALVHPCQTWNSLQDWKRLARHADLPYTDILRYRLELFEDRDFQAHLADHGDVGYVTSGPELYAVVRTAKPKVVVETGVASGVSSAHILRALAANGSGTLHSIDLPNVQKDSVLPEGRSSGWIVPQTLRDRWQLQLGDSRTLLPALLATLDHVDFFFHDSDHSYEAMSFEFEQVFPKLRIGALVMSDDTHLHTAWDDFCATHRLSPTRVAQLGVTRNRSQQ